MTLGNLLVWLVVGLVAGWLTGVVMKGRGYGFFADILLGIVGACFGGLLFGLLGIFPIGVLANTIVAFVGGMLFVALVRAVRRGPAVQDL
jgi:uncharacterized membrane protein YeaQ/YmgE (transglycosylase-associated protein family)